jgi:hypothetical protein
VIRAPNKCEVLSSNPSATKKEKKKGPNRNFRNENYSFLKLKNNNGARNKWLMPGILDTWEAEIRRIKV